MPRDEKTPLVIQADAYVLITELDWDDEAEKPAFRNRWERRSNILAPYDQSTITELGVNEAVRRSVALAYEGYEHRIEHVFVIYYAIVERRGRDARSKSEGTVIG